MFQNLKYSRGPVWVSRLPSLRSQFAGGHRSKSSFRSRFLQVSEEVQQAVAEKRPVVALESTIYTHGFPYPENLALAARLEALVRTHGAVPATIGILDGVASIGMGADQLVKLVSTAGSGKTLKVSRRDLGFVSALRDVNGHRLNGGTTVAATMILANLAGIDIFATGGLGGVHRGVEETMDVSADLTELGRTPVAVISSGCKSFLDIPRTLEYLETQGVAVATFMDGRDSSRVDFPAFYSRDSGIRSPMTLRDELEAAEVIHAHISLGLTSGLAFASPIPEAFSIPHAEMEVAIERALTEAKTAGATGAASTPYILAKLKEISGSRSVQANTALVEANVIRGAKIAVALAKLRAEESQSQAHHQPELLMIDRNNSAASSRRIDAKVLSSKGPVQVPLAQTEQRADMFVAGSLAVDLSCDFSPIFESAATTPEAKTSNPAVIQQTLGGVGQNVARAAHIMGAAVRLCSAVGDDLSGKAALDSLQQSQMAISCVQVLGRDTGSRTAQYVAINDRKKDLVLAMADMDILGATSGNIEESFRQIWQPQIEKHRPNILAVDGNWHPEHLTRWLQLGEKVSAMVAFEPVSKIKSTTVFRPPVLHSLRVFPSPSIHLATPNAYELAAMHATARENGIFDRQDWWEVIDALGIPSSGARAKLAMATNAGIVDSGIPQQSIQLLPFIPILCTKLGEQGVLLTQLIPANDTRLTDGEYAPYILSRCNNDTERTLGVGGLYMRLFPPAESVAPEDIVSVNGVGDTFAGTLLAAMARRGKSARAEDWIDIAQQAAVLTLKSKESVSSSLGKLRSSLFTPQTSS